MPSSVPSWRSTVTGASRSESNADQSAANGAKPDRANLPDPSSMVACDPRSDRDARGCRAAARRGKIGRRRGERRRAQSLCAAAWQFEVEPEPRNDVSGPTRFGSHLQQQSTQLVVPMHDVVGPLQSRVGCTQRTQRTDDAYPERKAERRQVGPHLGERPADRERQPRSERREPVSAPPPAPGSLQLGEDEPRRSHGRRLGRLQVFVGRGDFEQDGAVPGQRQAGGVRGGAQRCNIEQFDGTRQLVAATLEARDLDAALPQLGDRLPDRGSRHGEIFGQALAGVQGAIGEQAHEALGGVAHRGRSNHRRRARFSLPARMRATFDRCVNTIKAAIATPNTTRGSCPGVASAK